MKIYLAGKVTKNGWRNKIVGYRCGIDAGDLDDPSEWPVLENVIFGKHDYVGPFLFSCDHGCFHGPGTHGMSSSEEGGCEAPYGGYGLERKVIVRCCLDAIHRADLVFCWLEAPEDYGSMVEVGYALALQKRVVVGGLPLPPFQPILGDDEACGELYRNSMTERDKLLPVSHWFVCEAAEFIEAPSPEEALRLAVNLHPEARQAIQHGLPVTAWKRCGSPIEKTMLYGIVTAAAHLSVKVVLKADGADTVLVECSGAPLVIQTQYQVCGHRADFFVEYLGVRAVVECDGHAFHERTKEQAQHDRELDRTLQREGFRVFRFTGSEIWKSPETCAKSLIEDLQRGRR